MMMLTDKLQIKSNGRENWPYAHEIICAREKKKAENVA
jgi:hypothetical protein